MCDTIFVRPNSEKPIGLFIKYKWNDKKTHDANVACVTDIVLRDHPDIKFGDFIISNKNRYRNSESYFWDGTKCISWDYKIYDDYGYLPEIFKCIDGQPIDIYTKYNTHNHIFWPSDNMRHIIKKYPFIPVDKSWENICDDNSVWCMYIETHHLNTRPIIFYFISHINHFPIKTLVNNMDCYSGIFNNNAWSYDTIDGYTYITMY